MEGVNIERPELSSFFLNLDIVHKLILKQIFVKPGLNGLKSAKLMLAIVLERKNNSTLIIMILIIIIMMIMIIIIRRRTTTLGMGISFLSIAIPHSTVRTISKLINRVILLQNHDLTRNNSYLVFASNISTYPRKGFHSTRQHLSLCDQPLSRSKTEKKSL